MARSALLSSATFAHLLGRAGKASAEDDKENDGEDAKDSKKAEDGGAPDDKREDETDEEYRERKRREREDEDDGEKASDDDDDMDMSDDDDDMDMSDDEEDEKDKRDAKARAARGRERARCAAIFGSKAAAARPDLAAHLAFETGLGRRAACKLLKAAAAGEPKPLKGLAMRMEGMEGVRAGQDRAAAPSARQAIASSWDAAARRAGVHRG